MISQNALEVSSSRVHVSIDDLEDIGGAELVAPKETPIEAGIGVLATTQLLELHENLAFGVTIDSKVHDLAVGLLALQLDFLLENSNPVRTVGGLLARMAVSHIKTTS
jgi:hypothetical protein